jgi:hypothetical protein
VVFRDAHGKQKGHAMSFVSKMILKMFYMIHKTNHRWK